MKGLIVVRKKIRQLKLQRLNNNTRNNDLKMKQLEREWTEGKHRLSDCGGDEHVIEGRHANVMIFCSIII